MRRIWTPIVILAAGGLPGLAAGVSLEPPAEAQDAGKAHAELVDRLQADGLTREEMVSHYAVLAGPFAVNGIRQPWESLGGVGFRGAR